MTSRERVVKALRFMIPMWAPMPNPFERMQHLRGSEQLFLDLWRPCRAENLGYARYPGRCPGLRDGAPSGLKRQKGWRPFGAKEAEGMAPLRG